MYPATAAATVMAVLATLTGPPADAEADALATFPLKLLDLSITAPSTASLGGGIAGGRLTLKLTTVTVNDSRLLPGSWTASVSSTDFTTTAPVRTIANGQMSYWSGPATATSGLGTFTPGQGTAADAVTLTASRTAFTHTGGLVVNSASWQPTLVLTIPHTAALGSYSGTITHSVQ